MSDEDTRILLLGPGPATIGEGAELDAGACEALRVLALYGVQAIVAGSSPVTLSSDPARAFRTYLEPLDAGALRAIVRRERPHGLCPIFGGDPALDLALALHDDGTLGDVGVALLGVSASTIRTVRDRERFEAALETASLEHARRDALAADTPGTWIGLELDLALDVTGYAVAGVIESLDGIGVHPGDAVSVAPPVSLGEAEMRVVRKVARGALRAIGLGHGVAHVELAFRRADGAVRVLDVSPRVSRSSATGRVATGFPLALVATELMLGSSLDEMGVAPPSRRGVVARWPRFAFEAFPNADAALSTTQKSVGESVGRGATVAEALRRAARGVGAPSSASAQAAVVTGAAAPRGSRVLVVGPGATRLGQGTELVTCAAEAVLAAKALGHDVALLDASPEAHALVASVGERGIVDTPSVDRVLAAHAETPLKGVVVLAAGEAAIELEAGLRAAGLEVLGSCGNGALAAVAESIGLSVAAVAPSDARSVDVEVLCDGASAIAAGTLEHLEPAFVHGADAAAITPPFSLLPDLVAKMEDAARRIALGLGVVGLATVNFVIEGDHVSIYEVTPRASRTTPFMTRATNLPLVAIATKLALGATLAELGIVERTLPPWTAARERVFPFAHMPGADPVTGPITRSLGEVIGIADTPARAYAKALRGLGGGMIGGTGPREVLVAVDEADHSAAVEIARRLRAIDYDIGALGSVRDALARARLGFRDLGADVASAARELGERRFAFAIVTARGTEDVERTRGLRASALASHTTCFTTVALAKLGCSALEEHDTAGVRSLQEWYQDA